MRLGDDVLVLDGNDRDVEADHRAGAAGEIAGGGDDVLAGDVALVGLDQPFAGRRLLDAGHRRVAVDFGAAIARAARERLRQVGGLDIAVVGMLDGAEDAVRLAERPDLLHLLRRQHVDVDADRARDAGIVHELVPAVLGAGEADVGADGEADVLAGLRLQRLVEGDRVFVDLADRVAHVEERQQPRRMPGRAGGQLLALDQDDIRPALLGQMVERRDADDASTDNNDPRLRFHAPVPRSCTDRPQSVAACAAFYRRPIIAPQAKGDKSWFK